MIRHIVLWRLKSPGDHEVIRRALVCDFESRAALEAYHKHPAHMETRAVVDPLITEHWIADYEL
jgi:hypothetical protein